jgi:hypothetical protein
MTPAGRLTTGFRTGRFARLAATLVPVLAVTGAVATAGTAEPAPVTIATGQDAGWPDVRAWTGTGSQAEQMAPWGSNPFQFAPYPTYQYGVRVAVGDVNGDGRPEIVTAPAKGGWTEIRVFDGTRYTQIAALEPFKGAAWWNGAFVTTGDTNGDGRAEIVDGLDAGLSTTIHVLDPGTGSETSGFWPYGTSNEAGTRVAAADLNGDGRAEILSVPIGSSTVSAFGPAGGNAFRVYDAFGGSAFGSATIAAGDVAGDRQPELVEAANTAAGVNVKVVDTRTGATTVSLRPFAAPSTVPPEVAVGDVNGDGRADIVVLAQFADGAQVKALDAEGHELSSFFVLEPGVAPGASLAAGDLDGDGKAEIVLGGGPTTTAPWPPTTNGPDQRVVVYRADGTLVGGFSAYPGLFQGGVRVAVADVERNGRPAVVTAPGAGLEPEISIFSQRWLATRDRGTRLAHFLAYERGFTGGVSVATGYWSGDPRIVVAPGPGRAPEIRVFDPQGRLLSSFLAFEPTYTGGLSVATGDLNADGRPEIVVGTLAAPARVRAFDATGAPYGTLIGPFPPDGRGAQVAVADVHGTGRGLIVVGENTGADPLLALVDPLSGNVVRVAHPAPTAEAGLRVGSGDLNQDGRDEILVSTGWAPSGPTGDLRVLGAALQPKWQLTVYNWAGAGMNLAAAPRIGMPLRATGLTIRLQAGTRSRVVAARFEDADGTAPAPARCRATIDWGDGTTWRGLVLRHGTAGVAVRSTKRYASSGIFRVTVTLTDDQQRTSVASSNIVVRART